MNDFRGYHLIVQEATTKNNTQSVLFEDYIHNSNQFAVVDAETVAGQCFVVESGPDINVVLLAKDKETWPSYFTDIYTP